jgi:hypothetical protein
MLLQTVTDSFLAPEEVYVFDKTKKINIKLRYIICLCLCQVLNNKRSIFELTDMCHIKIWQKINQFVNLNKEFNINMSEIQISNYSNTVKIVDKYSIITIMFSENKISAFDIVVMDKSKKMMK